MLALELCTREFLRIQQLFLVEVVFNKLRNIMPNGQTICKVNLLNKNINNNKQLSAQKIED